MSRPPGLAKQEEEEGDDAALIDSFFLPGGILDPDDDDDAEEGEQDVPNVSRLPPGMSRIPSNPWGNDFLQETQAKGLTPTPTEAPNDTILLDSNPAQLGGHKTPGSTAPVLVPRPPPGYTNRPKTQGFLGSTVVSPTAVSTEPRSHIQTQDSLTKRTRVDSAQGDNVTPQNQDNVSALHPPPLRPIPGPPPGFQDRTIRRPHQGLNVESTTVDPTMDPSIGLAPGEKVSEIDATIADTGEALENPEPAFKLVGMPRTQTNGKDQLQASPFMAFIDPDSDEDNSATERSGAMDENRLDTAEDMEGTGDLTVPEGDDEDDEDDEINESTRGDSPFPMRMLTYIDSGSTTSSISTSSDTSGSDQDESQHSDVEDDDERAHSVKSMGEITDALNSEVAVILDVTDSREHGAKSDKSGNEDGHTSSISESHSKKNGTGESTSIQDLILEKLSTVSLSDSTIQNNLREMKTNVVSQISVWKNTFHEYSAWMNDFTEVMAVLTATTWKTMSRAMTYANKAFAYSSMFLFQIGKFAFVEIIEEPKVTICYIIFYFMPYFCSLLLRFFIIPHWTPHFITTIAVWSLCSQTTPGRIQMGTISIRQVPDLFAKNGGVLSTEARPRDERACRTILHILRLVLPIFFFADGFSTEFGTIMGVSGSSRLTTAYMMSLVRKSLVSSPIGWVSWAVQVLLATHHPSSFVVDLLVLISGLSSIRLIRYLEVRRSGSKKRHGKQH
jgi:hypothetical protein